MKLSRHFRIIAILLSVIGAWDLDIRVAILRYAYRAYFILYQICYIMMLLSLGMQAGLAIRDRNWANLLACMSIFVPYLQGIMKLNLLRSDAIQNLLTQFAKQEERIMSSSNATVKKMYMEYCKRANRSYVINFAIAMECIVLYCMYPPVPVYPSDGGDYRNATPKFVPLSAYFWFDQYEHIRLANFFGSAELVVGSVLCGIIDAMFFGLVIYNAGQVLILNHFFENIYEYAMDIEVHENEPSDAAQIAFTKGCITMYQDIIGNMATLDKKYRNFMLFSFLMSSLRLPMVALLILQATVFFTVGNLSLISYFIFELVGLHYNYWYANEILNESSGGLSVAIFKGKWYLCNERVKKALLFTIFRSRQPCKIGIGPFYVMNLTAVIMILRAGYGYLTLMTKFAE